MNIFASEIILELKGFFIKPKLYLIIVLLAFNCSEPSQPKQSEFLEKKEISVSPISEDFDCKLITNKTVYQLGQTPNLQVEIINLSDSAVYLISSLEGSEDKLRMPYCFFTIEKPKLDSLPKTLLKCGIANSLRLDDFVLIKPNEAFNPYKDIDEYSSFKSQIIKESKQFRNKGKYRIQFHYSTKSGNLEDYKGSPGEIKEDIKLLWKKVPKIELSSNIIEIEIK